MKPSGREILGAGMGRAGSQCALNFQFQSFADGLSPLHFEEMPLRSILIDVFLLWISKFINLELYKFICGCECGRGVVVNDKFSFKHVGIKVLLGHLYGYIMLAVDNQVQSPGGSEKLGLDSLAYER